MSTHPGTALQHIQIVKGWVDATAGQTRERIYDVAGDPNNGATVDTTSCRQSGPGADELCATWTDPDFHGERAFYYARVLENPSCRHTAADCQAIPLDHRPAYCSDPRNLTLQERAWTSPIWYRP